MTCILLQHWVIDINDACHVCPLLSVYNSILNSTRIFYLYRVHWYFWRSNVWCHPWLRLSTESGKVLKFKPSTFVTGGLILNQISYFIFLFKFVMRVLLEIQNIPLLWMYESFDKNIQRWTISNLEQLYLTPAPNN